MKTKLFFAAALCFSMFLSSPAFAQKKPVNLNSEADIADLRADAERGDRGAQYELSMVYTFQQDKAASFEWLKKSADNGFGKAQFALGNLYFNGDEYTKRNYSEALKWLELSAESGYAGRGVKTMIEISKGKILNAWRYLKPSKSDTELDVYIKYDKSNMKNIAAQASQDSGMQYSLAVYYYLTGSEKNALKTYQKAQSQGSVKAVADTAFIYFDKALKGGKEKDFEKAAAYAEKIKNEYSGYTDNADFWDALEQIISVSRSSKEEKQAFREDTAQNILHLQESGKEKMFLEIIDSMLTGYAREKADIAEYTEEYVASLEKDNPSEAETQFAIASYYFINGSEKDYIKWYKKAARNGSADAELIIGLIYYKKGSETGDKKYYNDAVEIFCNTMASAANSFEKDFLEKVTDLIRMDEYEKALFFQEM